VVRTRLAANSDSRLIYELRNDELARQMSHTSDFIEWEGHSKWFASSLKNKHLLLLICEDEDTAQQVAVVRFDVESDRAFISINLSPLMRGKGEAKNCLKSALGFFAEFCPNVSHVDAEIKLVNVASKRSFEGVGFLRIREELDMLLYEYRVKN